jgi:hypothetical protein
VILGALEGAVLVGGLSALGAGLYSIGMGRTKGALAATRHQGMKQHACGA